MIYMFIGPSSSGKDTFYKYALEKYKLNPIILHTTRPKRDGDIEGESYYFVTKEQLDQMEQNNELVERRDYDTIYGIWSYATAKKDIDLHKNYLTQNTWEGYQKFNEYYDKNVVIPIYFDLDKGVRLERALERERKQTNPKYDELCRRFLADCEDYDDRYIELYDPFIIDNNGSIENTQKQVDQILKLVK